MDKTNKKEMEINEFNTINTDISKLIETLKKYENAGISTAVKNLQEAGRKVGEFYYKYAPNTENNS